MRFSRSFSTPARLARFLRTVSVIHIDHSPFIIKILFFLFFYIV